MIAYGTANAKNVMNGLINGELDNYHSIEIMACPGSCIGGGGQLIPTSPEIRKNVPKLFTRKIVNFLYENHMKILTLSTYTKILN